MAKKTAAISVTAKQITESIFPSVNHGSKDPDSISMLCNWCGESFFTGPDVEVPESNWLEEIIIHLTEKHAADIKEKT